MLDGADVDATGGVEGNVLVTIKNIYNTLHHGLGVHLFHRTARNVDGYVQFLIVNGPPHDVAGSKVFLYVINHFFKGIPKNILDFTQFLFFAEKLVVKRQLAFISLRALSLTIFIL